MLHQPDLFQREHKPKRRRKPSDGRRQYAFNDHHLPFLTRYAVQVDPRLKGFFELRETGTERQGEFDVWVTTAFGQKVCAQFIKLALGVQKRDKKIGARAIWERIRWNWSVIKDSHPEARELV